MNKILLSLLIVSQTLVAQKTNSNHKQEDSTYNSKIVYVSSAIGIGYVGSLITLQNVWYKEKYQEKFHLFNDGNNWLQMDKFGHGYTSYQLARGFSELYEWTGVSNKNATIIGSSISLSYLTCMEIMDGYSKDWGFSTWDITANIGGTALYIGQDLLFSKQIFLPKFSFHKTKYASLRPEVLGSNFGEQLLKDYNGQTYWISFSPGNLGANHFPKWLCLSLGYSADAKIIGNSDYYLNYKAKREFLLSLDLDLSEINVKNTFLKRILKQINLVKVPFPAFYFSNNQWGFRPIYF